MHNFYKSQSYIYHIWPKHNQVSNIQYHLATSKTFDKYKQAFRDFVVSPALISNLNVHKM